MRRLVHHQGVTEGAFRPLIRKECLMTTAYDARVVRTGFAVSEI
jgi:hypothetical protein